MIVAAGLSPAWQQILEFDAFTVGEVNRARQAVWCSSGKVLNVGLALGHLGAPSTTVALVGGAPSEAIEREFADLGFARRWVTAFRPTRACTTLLDRATGQTTELVENATAVTAEELTEFRQQYAEVAATAKLRVLSGSLPPGTPPTFYRELLQAAPGTAILDARGPELLAALEERPLLVKPNREELARTVGRPLAEEADLWRAMREIVERGAAWIVVTHGSGEIFGANDRESYCWTPVRVPTVNPIGCGDCLAAGVAVALAEGLDVPAAVAFGIAAAADNAAQLLPGRLDRQRIERLERQVSIERLANRG
ncbi:MAG: PfkB family carbohydrate kinase [Pirellulales bacterium]